jgi:hypothetical protein
LILLAVVGFLVFLAGAGLLCAGIYFVRREPPPAEGEEQRH